MIQIAWIVVPLSASYWLGNNDKVVTLQMFWIPHLQNEAFGINNP